MTTRLRPLARVAAALVAVLALVVAPLRPVLDCTMPSSAMDAAMDAAMDEHAGHEMPPSDAGSGAQHPCPDLAHCVVVAPLAVGTSIAVEPIVAVRAQGSVETRPASATSSLEPPPPK